MGFPDHVLQSQGAPSSAATGAKLGERAHGPTSLSLVAWGPVILGCSFQEERSGLVGYASILIYSISRRSVSGKGVPRSLNVPCLRTYGPTSLSLMAWGTVSCGCLFQAGRTGRKGYAGVLVYSILRRIVSGRSPKIAKCPLGLMVRLSNGLGDSITRLFIPGKAIRTYGVRLACCFIHSLDAVA